MPDDVGMDAGETAQSMFTNNTHALVQVQGGLRPLGAMVAGSMAGLVIFFYTGPKRHSSIGRGGLH